MPGNNGNIAPGTGPHSGAPERNPINYDEIDELTIRSVMTALNPEAQRQAALVGGPMVAEALRRLSEEIGDR